MFTQCALFRPQNSLYGCFRASRALSSVHSIIIWSAVSISLFFVFTSLELVIFSSKHWAFPNCSITTLGPLAPGQNTVIFSNFGSWLASRTFSLGPRFNPAHRISKPHSVLRTPAVAHQGPTSGQVANESENVFIPRYTVEGRFESSFHKSALLHTKPHDRVFSRNDCQLVEASQRLAVPPVVTLQFTFLEKSQSQFLSEPGSIGRKSLSVSLTRLDTPAPGLTSASEPTVTEGKPAFA